MPPITVLQDIARRASGLQQPALPTHARVTDAASRAAVRVAWKRWLRFGGGGDRRLLKKRMRYEGLRPSSLYQPAKLDALPESLGESSTGPAREDKPQQRKIKLRMSGSRQPEFQKSAPP